MKIHCWEVRFSCTLNGVNDNTVSNVQTLRCVTESLSSACGFFYFTVCAGTCKETSYSKTLHISTVDCIFSINKKVLYVCINKDNRVFK